MTAPREVVKADIRRMLDDCAPGHESRDGKRRTVLKYQGKVHHPPKGDRTLEVGHLRKIITQLEIDRDCAKRHFPAVSFN